MPPTHNASGGNGIATHNATATAGALRRLQSATLTVGDLVDAITATLPGVKTAKLVLLETGQSPTEVPLFNGLSPELLPNALDRRTAAPH